ncbi:MULTISPECIES: DUF6556 family protein [unclassified Streptococcus]|uniref:DUF6556 family protein n=1 Tax=unclassified Streptococcus TaxID=2608887 RepID=UPI000AED273B|nr:MULTISPECIES: DUF6556 family protein [unclassified Streptococcus]
MRRPSRKEKYKASTPTSKRERPHLSYLQKIITTMASLLGMITATITIYTFTTQAKAAPSDQTTAKTVIIYSDPKEHSSSFRSSSVPTQETMPSTTTTVKNSSTTENSLHPSSSTTSSSSEIAIEKTEPSTDANVETDQISPS